MEVVTTHRWNMALRKLENGYLVIFLEEDKSCERYFSNIDQVFSFVKEWLS